MPFVDPRKPLSCCDIPLIDCLDSFERCAFNTVRFCKEGNQASKEAPSAKKTWIKLICCVLYYVPFLVLFTHNYPNTTVGCLVGIGSIVCEPAKGRGIASDTIVRIAECNGGLMTTWKPCHNNTAVDDTELNNDENNEKANENGNRFLKGGGKGGGKSGPSSSASAAAYGGAKGGNRESVIIAKTEDSTEPENFTLLYKAWFLYGILWFTFSALVEILNICNGRELGARKVVVCCGSCLSVVWYILGLILRMSNGGRVAAGDFIDMLTDEEYE